MNLKQKIQSNQTLFTAWSLLPDPLWAGALAATDFDVVTLDMQHGGHSDESVLRCIGPVIQNGAHPVVRVPVGRFDMASRALDFGAEAVIAPMINTLDDAKGFADFMKYPPLGQRSWGPGRAMAFHGHSDANAYFKAANSETLAIAMIETMDAFEIANDILALPGIDGIFVGPADLSIGWSHGAFVNPLDEGMTGILRDLAARSKAAGKFAASFGINAAHAKFLSGLGFQLIAISTDTGCLTAGADTMIAAARA
ncbi:MAG: aldolase/citrate lyase family protein [Rhizobiaceae bacterium]